MTKKKKTNVNSWNDVKTEVFNLVRHMKKGNKQAEVSLLQKIHADSRYLVIVRNLANSKKGKDNRGKYTGISINNINRGGVWGYRN